MSVSTLKVVRSVDRTGPDRVDRYGLPCNTSKFGNEIVSLFVVTGIHAFTRDNSSVFKPLPCSCGKALCSHINKYLCLIQTVPFPYFLSLALLFRPHRSLGTHVPETAVCNACQRPSALHPNLSPWSMSQYTCVTPETMDFAAWLARRCIV